MPVKLRDVRGLFQRAYVCKLLAYLRRYTSEDYAYSTKTLCLKNDLPFPFSVWERTIYQHWNASKMLGEEKDWTWLTSLPTLMFVNVEAELTSVDDYKKRTTNVGYERSGMKDKNKKNNTRMSLCGEIVRVPPWWGDVACIPYNYDFRQYARFYCFSTPELIDNPT